MWNVEPIVECLMWNLNDLNVEDAVPVTDAMLLTVVKFRVSLCL